MFKVARIKREVVTPGRFKICTNYTTMTTSNITELKLFVKCFKELIVFDTMSKFIFIISLPQTEEHNIADENLCKFVHCNQGLGRFGTTLRTEATTSETLLTSTPIYSAS
jgi:hypothetical protein